MNFSFLQVCLEPLPNRLSAVLCEPDLQALEFLLFSFHFCFHIDRKAHYICPRSNEVSMAMLYLILFLVPIYISIFRYKMNCVKAQKDSHTVANCPWGMLSLKINTNYYLPTKLLLSHRSPVSCRYLCLLCCQGR